MNALAAVRIALRALRVNKMRSILTMLGIIFGVAAVIIMIAVGSGAQARVEEQIKSLGSNLMVVFPGTVTASGVRLGAGSRNTLTENDAQAIQEEIPRVLAAAPGLRGTGQLVHGNLNCPKSAPNVLLIITDDAGYGVAGTFGGVIPTPALDRIAQNGQRYTNFHSTALSSPTRAALITGRNHHSAGFGVVAEQATGYPGYDSVITKDKATIGRILKDNGYRTAWFGKNHNTPEFQASQAGPFDQWPVGMGFEYFVGFMGGDTNQWEPGNLVRNTTPIYPFVGNPGWNLSTAMADEAIDYMNRMNALTPDQPFFVKFAPGATHAPHHPTKEWEDKISAMHLGKHYSAARMLPGFGEIYQPLGVQAAQEALHLLPGDGRPHHELALLYASVLPENATKDDLKTVMDELQIVEELEPDLAPNIHDTLDFLGAFWAVETARAEASLTAEPSTTTAPTQEPTLTATPVPSITSPPLSTEAAPAAATGGNQGMILGVAILLIVLVLVGILIVKRLRGSSG